MEDRLGHITKDRAWDIGRALKWPDDVIGQLLVDHGHRIHIAEQFEHLDLTTLAWTLDSLPAAELIGASHHEQKARVETVAEDPHAYVNERRAKGFDLWPSGTWARPPLFIEGHLVYPPSNRLHLLEGHTRLGILTGLVQREEVEPDSVHHCWIAREKPSLPNDPRVTDAAGLS